MFNSRASRSRAPFRALIVAAVAALASSFLVFTPPATQSAEAASLPSSILEGGYIISDAEFFDSDSMTASQIQSFLNSKVSSCKATSGPDCLKSFRSTMKSKSADKYCKAIKGKSNARASDIIAAVSTACGINPKVILVMLQKEQGLVTSTAPSNWNIQQAMGQACPDTAQGCDPAYSGFFNQVYYGARQLQVYTKNPTSFNYQAGKVNTIKWHPNSSCGTSKVYIQNQATANLYIYTPYRANVAALAAGYGTGDACSAYGNRNFYNYYVDWFQPDASSSSGAPAQIAACTTPASSEISSRSGTGTVTTTSLNVRTAPTMHCTSGMTTVSKGTTVTITGQYGAWTRAKLNGKTVWLASSYLKTTAAPAPSGSEDACAVPSSSSISSASGTVTITTGVLNARQAPSTSCDTSVVQLKLGNTATRTGTYGDWWRIERSGKTYWIHSDYATVKGDSSSDDDSEEETTTTSEKMVTTHALNLRKSASTSAGIIVVLAKGTTVTVTASDGKWRKVKAGSKTGWVHSDYLKKPSTSSSTPSTSTSQKMKTTDWLNLREKASTSSKIITSVKPGTTVTVTDSSGAWRKVKVGSKTGWMHADYLKSASTTPTTTAWLNLRKSNSTSSTILAVIPKGTKVTVTATKGSWSKVKWGSRTGWVSTSYLK